MLEKCVSPEDKILTMVCASLSGDDENLKSGVGGSKCEMNGGRKKCGMSGGAMSYAACACTKGYAKACVCCTQSSCSGTSS